MTLSVTLEPNHKRNLCPGLQGKRGVSASFQAGPLFTQIYYSIIINIIGYYKSIIIIANRNSYSFLVTLCT